MRGIRNLVAPYAVLAAEVLAFYWKVLFLPGAYVIPWDLRYYHLSMAHFMARSFGRGELPLWDPYTYCGFPYYANLTAGLFYPPMVATVLLSNWTGGRLLYFLELQVVGHVLLAGIFTYGLLRRLGVGRTGALAGATVYQLGAFFASQSQHLGAVSAAAWMPLAWLGVVALAEGFTWRRVALVAFALAMPVLAGFPAETAVVFGSVGLLTASLILFRRADVRLLGALSLAAVWGLWLSAAQLLPTMELTRRSVAALRSQWMGTGGGIPVQALASMLFPNYWGVFRYDPGAYKLPWNPTFLYLYCGLSGLLLAIWALMRHRKRALPFAAVALASALWMLGDKTPLGRELFPRLPSALRSSIYPEFAMSAFTLALAVLAGLGAQALGGQRRRAVQAALVLLVAGELIVVSSGRRINTASVRDEAGVDYGHFGGFTDVPQAMRRLVNQTDPPARTDILEGSIVWADAARLFEVPSANGNDPFALVSLMQVRLHFCKGERWGRYYEVADPSSAMLDRINVRYLLSNSPQTLPPKYRKVADLRGQQVYENTAVRPRFELQTVGGAPVRVLRYEPQRVVLETDSQTATRLITSETAYPGWHASVDGRATALETVDGAFRAIALPAGRHRVEMWFSPGILWWSMALAAVAWILLAVQAMAGVLPRK